MANEMYQNNADVQQAVTAALDEQKKKKKKKRWIIIAVIAAIIVVGAVLGSSNDETQQTNDNGGSNTTQQVSEAPQAVDGKLGDYVCTLKSATRCKDWEGKDSVKIVYSFTNNSSDSQSFDTALEDKVYQDGIALETTFTSSDEEEIWDVEIKPGITKEVTKVYNLRNTTSNLEIEVGEWISFDDTKYKTTVTF